MADDLLKKPLYVYLEQSEHKFISELKTKTGLSKSDIIALLLINARKHLTDKDIIKIYDELLLSESFR